jgi:hypothetical protein
MCNQPYILDGGQICTTRPDCNASRTRPGIGNVRPVGYALSNTKFTSRGLVEWITVIIATL